MSEEFVGYIPKAFLKDHTLDMNGIENCLNRCTGETTARCLLAIGAALLNPGLKIEVIPDSTELKLNRLLLLYKKNILLELVDKLGLTDYNVYIEDGKVLICFNHVVRVYKETTTHYTLKYGEYDEN